MTGVVTDAETSQTPTTPPPAPHSPFEDVFGLVTGAVVASLGLFLLKSAGAVTGGTAGIGLLLSYVTHLAFGGLYFAVTLPFLVLAYLKKGPMFTLRTLIAVAGVSALAYLHPHAIGSVDVNPVYGVLLGNLLAGIGLLILFRHDASLGGLNTVAILVQEHTGLRAGYVQLCFDLCIILVSLTVVSLHTALLSAAGAVVLNLVLAVNHRPGRYLGF